MRILIGVLACLFLYVLGQALPTHDAGQRNTMLVQLIHDNAPGLPDALFRALDDDDIGVREIALSNLDKMSTDRRTIPSLRTHLASEGIETRWLVVRAIAQNPMAFIALATNIRKLAADPDPLIRKALLAHIRPGPGVVAIAEPILRAALARSDATSRMSAAQSWQRLGLVADVQVLNDCLRDLANPDPVVSGASSYCLYTLWSESVAAQLRRALNSKDLRLRAHAADILRKRGAQFDSAVLSPVFRDGDEASQLYVCGTLARIQTASCVPVLRRALRSRYARVRQAAVYALEPSDLPVAIACFREASHSPDPNIRRRAAVVLGREASSAEHAPPLANIARLRDEALRRSPHSVPVVAGRPTKVHDGVLSVGNQKQLLVDGFALEDLGGAVRVQHKFRKDPSNPVLEQEYPWELQGVNNYCNTVDYDPASRLFRMWYTSYWRVPGDKKNAFGTTEKNRLQLLAYSLDGIRWVRPNLGVLEYKGSRDNNLVESADNLIRLHQSSGSPFRYASFSPQRKGRAFSLAVSFSRNATSDWTPPEKATDAGGDVATIVRDDLGDGYFGFVKWRAGWWLGHSFPPVYDYATRVLLKTPSTGFRAFAPVWSATPDHLAGGAIGVLPSPSDDRGAMDAVAASFPGLDFFDPGGVHKEVYEVAPFPYEGIYFGIPSVFVASGRGGSNDDGTVGQSLIYSRDPLGKSGWQRPAGAQFEPVLDHGMWGEWDSTQSYTPNTLLVIDDQIVLYYSAAPHGHEPKGAHSDSTGNRAYRSAIGRATLRLDGFVSLHAGGREAVITTRPMAFQGASLEVNAACPKGSLSAELLDRNGKIISGFERSRSLQFQGDQIRHKMQWSNSTPLGDLAGQSVRIRFHLRNGDLYSFRFE
jgi:HEAT repeat protein